MLQVSPRGPLADERRCGDKAPRVFPAERGFARTDGRKLVDGDFCHDARYKPLPHDQTIRRYESVPWGRAEYGAQSETSRIIPHTW